LTDDELLMEVYKLIDDSDLETKTTEITENHKLARQTAINQIANGDFLSNDQANKEAREWLNR